MPLTVQDPYARLEGEMRQLAAAAVSSISSGLAAGAEPGDVVADVVHDLFGAAAGASGGALADRATQDRIVAAVRAILSAGDD
ncbi:hypothetical protein [Actinoplanes auranticolor]|nr:hypothetical protein [Actinoplanes auranticolor]